MFNRRCSIPFVSSLTLAIVCFFGPQQPASASLFSFADELLNSSQVGEKYLKTILKDDRLYSKLIKELVPDTTTTIGKGAFKEVLRREIFKFAVEGSEIAWERSDMLDFVGRLLTRKCSANVSCQIAFDLTPLQVETFIQEMASTAASTYKLRSKELTDRLAMLKEGAGAKANAAEIATIEKQLEDLQKFDIAAIKLSNKVELPNLTPVCP